MKPSTVLGLALTLSVTSAALTSLLLLSEPRAEARERGPRDAGEVAALARRLDALEASVAELRATLAAPIGRGRASPREAAIDERALERAVEQVLAKRERRADAEETEEDALAVSKLLAELFALDIDDIDRARIWQELRDGGHIAAAVAEFERRAAAAPYDSLAQTELGWAYFQKMVTTGGGPEAGRWGAKGADMLERALELDETNWDARYTLAQHFSYADMRGDSIRHLERLVDQQKGRLSEPKHANAYVLLGSLHMDAGRSAEALNAWKAGLHRFPTNQALLERLSAYE